MTDPNLLRAAIAGLALVTATGPLGCFVLWGRMAYFGDSMGHAAILGVALALASGWPIAAGTMLIGVIMAFIVVHLSGRSHGTDTILGVIAHGSLALGLVSASLVPALQVDLEDFLFGDIMAISWGEVWLTLGVSVAVLALLAWRWQRMVAAVVNEEMAAASGIHPRHERLILTLALAVVVAISIRLVGSLLIAALLVIPAASARRNAHTPEAMALRATLSGIASLIGGLALSLYLGAAAGPSIVVISLAIFALSWLQPVAHHSSRPFRS